MLGESEVMRQTVLVSGGTSILTNALRELKKTSVSDAELAAYLAKADPVKASAETNSLGRLDLMDTELVFLHSDTEEGRRCGAALVAYFKKRGTPARSRELSGLDYRPKSFANAGLRSLVSALVEEIQTARVKGSPTKINATGPFATSLRPFVSSSWGDGKSMGLEVK